MVSYNKIYLPVDSDNVHDISESISVTGRRCFFFVVKISNCIYELQSICVHFH